MYLILSAALLFLHDLCHEITHLFGCTFLHLPRDVGVGAEREACVEMAKHTGYCLYVHAILERQGRECVSQVMKSQVFQSRVFQDFLMNVDHRIGVVHFACFRGRKHPRVIGIPLMFCDQQIDGLLWN